MNPISVFAAGTPVGQPRPRACARAGRARVYDPGTAEAWKGCIALALKPVLPPAPLAGPVKVIINHVMPRPKSHFGTGRNAGVLKPRAPLRHQSKPDCDNLLKAALDAMTQVGVWQDDDQVCACTVTKSYGSRPGAFIEISPLSE